MEACIVILIVCLCSTSAETLHRLTLPSKNTHPTCKKNDIFHSDIVEDHSLKRGLSSKNYTMLGKVPNMADCMALCCSAKHCSIAYMRNNTCYGVTCFDIDKCGVQNTTEKLEGGVKLALIIRNEMNRRVYVTAYMVVVICAFGAAMSGTVWAVFVFYKRYSFLSLNEKGGDEEEKEEMLPRK